MENKEFMVLNQSEGFNMTEKYKPIKTQDVLDQLQERGFKIESTVITKPRRTEKQGFQKHMIRLSHEGLQLRNVNDSRPELVLVNSYDGTTSLNFMIGVYRIVCSNGLIVGSTYDGVSIRHVGSLEEKINDAIKHVETHIPMVAESINEFKNKTLTESKKLEFLEQSAMLVLPKTTISVQSRTIDKIRRADDLDVDLWTLYNRVQESVIRGGIQYITKTVNPETQQVSIRNNTTRAVKSIGRQIELNKELWTLTENFAKVA